MNHFSIKFHKRCNTKRKYYKKSKMLKRKDKINLLLIAIFFAVLSYVRFRCFSRKFSPFCIYSADSFSNSICFL